MWTRTYVIATAVVVLAGLLARVQRRRVERRRAAEAAHAATLIGTPQYVKDEDGRSDYRPELRTDTQARRERAEAARRHAARVDTGGACIEPVTQRRRA